MRLSLKILFILFFTAIITPIYSDIPYVTGPNDSTALQGADIVAYFTDGKYTKGTSANKVLYNGVLWYFSSQEHMEQFKRNPQQFIPQYHGYSAYDMAKGKRTDSIPTLWCVYENKLYLNHNAKVHRLFLKNKGSFITGGDLNWKRMLKTPETPTTVIN